MGEKQYDDPNFLLIRQANPVGDLGAQGSISTPALTSEYVGSTLKVFTKAVVLGCTFMVQSGASITGTATISIARVTPAGAVSEWEAKSFIGSAGASMAGTVIDISCKSALTLHSIGESAALIGNAASLDKVPILKNIIWRYRLLPQVLPSKNLG